MSSLLVYVLSKSKVSFRSNRTQQSVHPTLGIRRHFQAFFYALPFFWLDGFAVLTPAQVNAAQTTPRLMSC